MDITQADAYLFMTGPSIKTDIIPATNTAAFATSMGAFVPDGIPTRKKTDTMEVIPIMIPYEYTFILISLLLFEICFSATVSSS